MPIADAYGFPLEGGTLAEQRPSIEGDSPCGGFLQLVRGASGTKNGLFFRAETAHPNASASSSGWRADNSLHSLALTHGHGWSANTGGQPLGATHNLI